MQVSSSPDKDDSRPQGGSPKSQICSTTYSPRLVGTHGTSWSSMQEKEAIVTSLETFTMGHTVSDKNHEAVKSGSALPENLGYVSDSPSRSAGEKQDGCVELSQETDTVKVKNEDHQDSQVIDTMKSDSGDGADCKEVHSSEAKIGIGGACQEPSATVTQDGDGGNCQELDATRADDGDGKECQKNDAIEADCLDGECQKVDATEAECGLNAGPCQEDLPAASSHDSIIADDEYSLDGNNDGQPTVKRSEQQACKRRKVMPPVGGRMRTRSFTRDFPS
ncbi:putative ubiquitin-like-specific protease [Cocos nucifera]|uniref:Putative ubiquitin-like-specific protease n=1 Tax=Cocos nucifera TaxID=13894 RepID=A0A8K0I163_COCNU|nr:putative ubiquitin-like-specific protease [Cocos nucifera]